MHGQCEFRTDAVSFPEPCPNPARHAFADREFGTCALARPATGFSIDLRELSKIKKSPGPCPKGILAPYRKNDKALEKKITQLRKNGKIVIVKLPMHGKSKDTYNCDKKLILKDKAWKIINI